MRLVYITCANEDEARKIARHLLEGKLIACANIVPKIESLYWWKGKIENETESLLLCKTLEGRDEKIVEEVKKMHSYDVPSIEFLNLERGNGDYFKWMEAVLK